MKAPVDLMAYRSQVKKKEAMSKGAGPIEHSGGVDKPVAKPHNQPMTDAVPRPEFDAKIALNEARVDARLASFERTMSAAVADFKAEVSRLESDMVDRMGSIKDELKSDIGGIKDDVVRLNHEVSALRSIKGNIWGAALATMTLVAAALAYGAGMFDSGRETAKLAAEAQRSIEASQRAVEASLAEIRGVAAELKASQAKQVPAPVPQTAPPRTQ